MCLHLWCATPAFVIRQWSERGRGDTKAGLTPQSHVFQRCWWRNLPSGVSSLVSFALPAAADFQYLASGFAAEQMAR